MTLLIFSMQLLTITITSCVTVESTYIIIYTRICVYLYIYTYMCNFDDKFILANFLINYRACRKWPKQSVACFMINEMKLHFRYLEFDMTQ